MALANNGEPPSPEAASIVERHAREARLQARFPAEGGWYAIVALPAPTHEENFAVALLHQSGVLVQPGYFFDFSSGSFAVVSLLPSPSVFDPAASALAAALR